MKRFILCAAAALAFGGCEKKGASVEEAPNGEPATIRVDYSFFESGDMSRAGADLLYQNFYESYVKTRQVTADHFELTFTDSAGETAAELKGAWSKENFLKLMPGTYHVTGTSYQPSMEIAYASLRFDEQVEITASTTRIVLTADYDCYLLLFDADGKTEMSFHTNPSGSAKPVAKVDNLYYLFGKENSISPNSLIRWQGGGSGSDYTNTVRIGQLGFQIGRYYYYNDQGGSFDLAPMQSGN